MIVMTLCLITAPAFAADTPAAPEETAATQSVGENESADSSAASSKALSAGIAIALVAAAGAISMGFAISKSAESISRQPEAAGNIRTSLMLGLVFIETAIIYALIIAILIIFVL